ncbi:MAG: response regulator transcription factor [Erysipelotrichaceae bacterium]
MKNKTTILIIEDELAISNFISAVLTSNDYAVLRAATGQEGITMAASFAPELILLDLGLPDMDGIDVLNRIRQWSDIPVIVVSARVFEKEKVQALDLGADDYITKPFGTSELLARVRTAIRHKQGDKKSEADESKIDIGNLRIDFGKHLVTVEGKEIHLTPIEYKILLLLARNRGKVLTLDYLSKEIWGPYTFENNALRVNMANIRRKIEKNPAEPQYILTEVGVGYRMKEDII